MLHRSSLNDNGTRPFGKLTGLFPKAHFQCLCEKIVGEREKICIGLIGACGEILHSKRNFLLGRFKNRMSYGIFNSAFVVPLPKFVVPVENFGFGRTLVFIEGCEFADLGIIMSRPFGQKDRELPERDGEKTILEDILMAATLLPMATARVLAIMRSQRSIRCSFNRVGWEPSRAQP